MVKNIFAGIGVILFEGISMLAAYTWGVDDGMYPEKNDGWLADTVRRETEMLRSTKD